MVLKFDWKLNRYILDGQELHCGDIFEVLVDEVWVRTAIEYNHNSKSWYLTGTEAQLDGLTARFSESQRLQSLDESLIGTLC